MADLASVQQMNQDIARRINEQARRDPRSAYAGKFVGIANGQVVIIADNLDEVARQLDECEPDPSKTFCIEAGLDYEAIQDIWMSS